MPAGPPGTTCRDCGTHRREEGTPRSNQKMVFPVVMYGCESWTMKKGERQRIDSFELWCWPSCDPQNSPDTPVSLEGYTEGPGTASSEPLLPS